MLRPRVFAKNRAGHFYKLIITFVIVGVKWPHRRQHTGPGFDRHDNAAHQVALHSCAQVRAYSVLRNANFTADPLTTAKTRKKRQNVFIRHV